MMMMVMVMVMMMMMMVMVMVMVMMVVYCNIIVSKTGCCVSLSFIYLSNVNVAETFAVTRMKLFKIYHQTSNTYHLLLS